MGEPVKMRRYFENCAAFIMFFVRSALWFLIVVLSSTTNKFLGLLALEIRYRLCITHEMDENERLTV